MEEFTKGPFELNEGSNKVLAVTLHLAENFGEFVTGTVNVSKYKNIILTQEEKGIRAIGPKCNKLVPWSNIRGVDYFFADGSIPVVNTGKV